MEDTTSVTQDSQPVISEDVKTQEPEAVTEEKPKVQEQSTHVPYDRFQEVVKEKQALEEEINNLKSSAVSEEVFSDEGRVLEKKIKTLETRLDDISRENAKKDLQLSSPIFKEKWDEFETFRGDPENKGMNLRTAAKAFLVENGLLDTPRKGLEKTTGGSRVPPSTGMTQDEVETLRKNNFRKYQDMLKKGQIKID